MRNVPFLVFPEAFGDDFCDAVIQSASEQQLEPGRTFDDKEGDRNSSVTFLNPSPSLGFSTAIFDLVSHANMMAFGFDISMCAQLQFTEYTEGQFYAVHADESLIHPKRDSMFDRKLSISILLVNPLEFSGGDLVIVGEKVELPRRGSAVVFPSFLQHEVTPVTSGVRKSLVSWIQGPMWR